MKTLLKLICMICLLSATAYAQGSRIDNSVLRPGTGIPGVKIAICQPLATTAAAVSGNQATYTMASNPIVAGFVNDMVVQVAGFTGGDTFFNAGTLVNGGIANGQIIVNVTTTQVVTTLIHANASATSNGTLLQVGTQTQGCGGLSSLFTDASLTVSVSNPNTADTLGNYGFGTQAGIYYVQIYGNGITTQMKQVIVPCTIGGACSTLAATSAGLATATTAGTCVSNTTAVTGATTSMVATASPVSTPGVGAVWSAFVSSAGNVTIIECAVAASAGGTIAFNIRVLP